jgi:hypothetical protein
MSVVKHNAPLKDVDWFDITYDCPKWGTTGTRVSREQLKTIDGETWYGKHEVITCTKVDRALMESIPVFNSTDYSIAEHEYNMERV